MIQGNTGSTGSRGHREYMEQAVCIIGPALVPAAPLVYTKVILKFLIAEMPLWEARF